MKRILGEYSQILGYTFTGLVFGLSFFILFINFYHYKEVSITVQATDYTREIYSKIQNNLAQVKSNASLYDVNSYAGSENKYELLSIQSRLNLCMNSFEDEKIKEFFDKKTIGISDVYKLESLYQQKVINGCIVKQIYDLTSIEGDAAKFTSNSVRTIAPFIKLESNALIKRTGFISSNIKNNSSYYFGNRDARNNIFDLTKDSYYEVLNSYEEASSFLVEISNWYVKVIGGLV